MSGMLARWNLISIGEAAKEILPCCGSTGWAEGMAAQRPFPDEATLLAASDETWRNLARADWMEAFHCHPRIGGPGIGESAVGESQVASATTAQSLVWSAQEQKMSRRRGTRSRPSWRRPTENTSGASITFLSCAPRANQGRRFWRFCGTACETTRNQNFTRLPSSSG